MLDVERLSSSYRIRPLGTDDADAILALCLQNTQYYRYCGKEPSIELVLSDLQLAPPGIDASAKHYLGFFERGTLVAVMDLVEGYPDEERCFIGFFMVDRRLQGAGVGSAIVQEALQGLREAGFCAVQLAIDKGNPQSTHFWKKNGFQVIREVSRDGGELLVAERSLL